MIRSLFQLNCTALKLYTFWSCDLLQCHCWWWPQVVKCRKQWCTQICNLKYKTHTCKPVGLQAQTHRYQCNDKWEWLWNYKRLLQRGEFKL